MKIKDINPYISGNFSEINKRLDEKEFEKYYQKWMSKYNTYFKNINDEKIVELGIRKWKALKEIFASATLFCEAEKAYKYKCEASMFFSLYYSLFHAQLACLYYETNLSFDELLHISHTKLGKVFEESFSKGKKSIVDNNLPNYFESLRDLREYYSYALPMNTLSYDTDIFEKTKLLIIQCYQVTLLQSLLL